MKFNIHVAHRDKPGNSWLEDYNRPELKTEDQARQYAILLIKNFNASLRPGESARKVVDVTFEDNNARASHEWQKTNLITLFSGNHFYDTLICLNCGVTAKRYGLDSIVFDSKYRKATKYLSCDWKKVAKEKNGQSMEQLQLGPDKE